MATVLFGEVRAIFHITGELVERRIVTSPKAPDWKLHIWKIASKGSTFEIEVPIVEFGRGVIDAAYQMAGKLSVDGGRTKLIAQDIKILQTKAAV